MKYAILDKSTMIGRKEEYLAVLVAAPNYQGKPEAFSFAIFNSLHLLLLTNFKLIILEGSVAMDLRARLSYKFSYYYSSF